MADSLRIRGQEIQIRLTRNGVLERTLTAIKSLTFTPKMDILREGYLGEKTDRRDNIYRGAAVELTFHPESSDALSLIAFIVARAKRDAPEATSHVNVVFVAAFPNGQRPRISVPDVKFGDIPFNMPARDQYVDMKLSGEAEDFTLAGV